MKGSLITLFLWPTGCEWHCKFCEWQSHCIVSYYQQFVSDIAHFVNGTLITSFPITNREWVTLHIVWKAVSSHFFLNSLWVTWHIFLKDDLMVSCPMTNRKWVTLHILQNIVSSCPLIWPTGSESHCTFCERWSCLTLLLCPIGSESHCTFCGKQSNDTIPNYLEQKVSDNAHLQWMAFSDDQ